MAKPRGETASFNVLTPRDTSLVIYDDIHQFLPEVCQPTQPAGEMAQKQMKLWELAAAEDQRVFSPYVWAIKLVMDAKVYEAHAGLTQYTSQRKRKFVYARRPLTTRGCLGTITRRT